MADTSGISPWWVTKITLALTLVVQAVLAAVTDWIPGPLVELPYLAGQIVVGCGALLVAWHYGLLKKSTSNIARPSSLVTSGGLYSRIRHPMYLGDFVVIVGLALLCPTSISAGVLAVAAVALVQLARFEDHLMEQRFPENFDDYRSRSRLIVPFLL